MNDMPAKMLSDWAKEEALDAISARFCKLQQGAEGLTVAEIAAFRRQQRRIAKLLGFSAEQTVPRSASVDTRPEGGDSTEIEAPFTSGATGEAGDAQC